MSNGNAVCKMYPFLGPANFWAHQKSLGSLRARQKWQAGPLAPLPTLPAPYGRPFPYDHFARGQLTFGGAHSNAGLKPKKRLQDLTDFNFLFPRRSVFCARCEKKIRKAAGKHVAGTTSWAALFSHMRGLPPTTMSRGQFWVPGPYCLDSRKGR